MYHQRHLTPGVCTSVCLGVRLPWQHLDDQSERVPSSDQGSWEVMHVCVCVCARSWCCSPCSSAKTSHATHMCGRVVPINTEWMRARVFRCTCEPPLCDVVGMGEGCVSVGGGGWGVNCMVWSLWSGLCFLLHSKTLTFIQTTSAFMKSFIWVHTWCRFKFIAVCIYKTALKEGKKTTCLTFLKFSGFKCKLQWVCNEWQLRKRGGGEEKEEGVEAEEEGNGTSEMFPITGVGEDRSCAWTDLRGRVEERSVVYMQRLLFPATACAGRKRGARREREKGGICSSQAERGKARDTWSVWWGAG